MWDWCEAALSIFIARSMSVDPEWALLFIGLEFLSKRAIDVCSSIQLTKSVKEGASARSAKVVLYLNHSRRRVSSRRLTMASMVPGSFK